MRAITFERFGGPDVLELTELPTPAAGFGQVLISVRAVGVNNIDTRIRAGTSGLPVTLPRVLGLEAAGEILDVGAGVESWQRGDRVAPFYQRTCGSCARCRAGLSMHCARLRQYGIDFDGGYAEVLVADAANLIALPKHITWPHAVSVQTTFGTAWRCLVTHARLQAGETVLISSAGSGVGSAALLIAQHRGARVIATAGTAAKRQRARDLGADATVDHDAPDFSHQVLDLTGGRGVDVAFTHVGGPLFSAEVSTVAIGGRVTVCGAHAGAIAELDLQELFRQERQIFGSARATRDEVRVVLDLVGAGRLEPVVGAVLPLTDAATAHREIERRSVFGKVVLQTGASLPSSP